MEFANVKYISLNGKSVFKEDCVRIPKYQTAKNLQPIIVDDFLKVSGGRANIALLQQYLEQEFALVPIYRESPEKWKDRQNFPYRVLLEITSKCNLRCVMCPRNVLKRQEIDMPKDLILRCIDEVNEHGVAGLWLYEIGEALLHQDFEEIFAYCQQKNNLGSLWFSTNGQELRDSTIDMLLNSNLTFLNYSLNAMSPESYHMISPKGDYKRLVANFEKLMEKKKIHNKMGMIPWVRIQMIDQPHVFSEIDEFLLKYSKKTELLSINVLEAYSQNILQNIGYAKKRKRNEEKYCKRIQRGDCFISSDGEVSLCDTDFNHEMSIGNVKYSTIEEIWNGETYRKYRLLNEAGRLNEIPICRSCLDHDL